MKTETITKMKGLCQDIMDTLNRIEELDTETTFDELDVGDWFEINGGVKYIKTESIGGFNAVCLAFGFHKCIKKQTPVTKVESSILEEV